ncbi:MAG TPA: endonuclease/exonuclease/phosphatase family protein, partial [Acidimicrobiales bacterium]|nr:endonuclease/exonuclease/phosphatase family protein [Acidimicrobiales bacterium]
FAAPELLAARPLPPWAGAAPHVRLFDANAGADGGNTDMAGYEGEIARDRPALATFEEISPSDFAQLEASAALRGLPHRYEIDGSAPWGFAVASRYPLHVVGAMWAAGNPFLVALTVDLPTGAIRLWVVHTDAPTLSRALWLSDLGRIAHREAARGVGRLLVAGDFNASWGNAGFDGVLGSGIADAAAARGHPYVMTWPQGDHVPPLVRIDHVLVGTGISATEIAAIPGPGSDHRALVATIAVRTP